MIWIKSFNIVLCAAKPQWQIMRGWMMQGKYILLISSSSSDDYMLETAVQIKKS